VGCVLVCKLLHYKDRIVLVSLQRQKKVFPGLCSKFFRFSRRKNERDEREQPLSQLSLHLFVTLCGPRRGGRYVINDRGLR
jgi:hypothetical protein